MHELWTSLVWCAKQHCGAYVSASATLITFHYNYVPLNKKSLATSKWVLLRKICASFQWRICTKSSKHSTLHQIDRQPQNKNQHRHIFMSTAFWIAKLHLISFWSCPKYTFQSLSIFFVFFSYIRYDRHFFRNILDTLLLWWMDGWMGEWINW